MKTSLFVMLILGLVCVSYGQTLYPSNHSLQRATIFADSIDSESKLSGFYSNAPMYTEHTNSGMSDAWTYVFYFYTCPDSIMLVHVLADSRHTFPDQYPILSLLYGTPIYRWTAGTEIPIQTFGIDQDSINSVVAWNLILSSDSLLSIQDLRERFPNDSLHLYMVCYRGRDWSEFPTDTNATTWLIRIQMVNGPYVSYAYHWIDYNVNENLSFDSTGMRWNSRQVTVDEPYFSVKELAIPEQFKFYAYPNPTNGSLNLFVNGKRLNNSSYELFDILGHRMNPYQLASGSYFAKYKNQTIKVTVLK